MRSLFRSLQPSAFFIWEKLHTDLLIILRKSEIIAKHINVIQTELFFYKMDLVRQI